MHTYTTFRLNTLADSLHLVDNMRRTTIDSTAVFAEINNAPKARAQNAALQLTAMLRFCAIARAMEADAPPE